MKKFILTAAVCATLLEVISATCGHPEVSLLLAMGFLGCAIYAQSAKSAYGHYGRRSIKLMLVVATTNVLAFCITPFFSKGCADAITGVLLAAGFLVTLFAMTNAWWQEFWIPIAFGAIYLTGLVLLITSNETYVLWGTIAFTIIAVICYLVINGGWWTTTVITMLAMLVAMAIYYWVDYTAGRIAWIILPMITFCHYANQVKKGRL